MKKLLLTIISCLLLFSCNKTNIGDNEFQSDILKVTSETIYLSNKANTKEISVTATNKFEATSNQDWLKVKVSSNKLILSTPENPNYSDRKATVTVTSKKIKRTFDVIQYGQNLILEVSQKQFNFAYTGGTENFTIKSNTEVNYNIDEPWLNIEKLEDGSFNIVCNPNEVTQERVAIINLFVDGIKLSELKVIQEQHPLPKFILPLSLFGQTTAIIKQEEDKRKETKLLEDKDTGTGSILNYEIPGDIFNKITYFINLNKLQKMTLYSKEAKISQENKNYFEEWLTQNDFVKVNGKGFENSLAIEQKPKVLFINAKLQMKIEFMADKYENYLCTYFPIQQKEYPTFTTDLFAPDTLWDINKINEYEAANGGAENASLNKKNLGKTGKKYDVFGFNVTGDNDGLKMIQYYVFKDGQSLSKKLFQITRFYDNPQKAFYQGLDDNIYVTNEFMEYLKRKGYTLFDYKKKSQVYKFKKINSNNSVSYVSCTVVQIDDIPYIKISMY